MFSIEPRKILVLILGMEGALGRVVARILASSSRYEILPVTTGRHGRRKREIKVRGVGPVMVYDPADLVHGFDTYIGRGRNDRRTIYVVDCSKITQWWTAANFAERLKLPVLMLGTIGFKDPGNEAHLDSIVSDASRRGQNFLLLRCPNALKPFVALMRALESIPEVTPGAFDGLKFYGSETHQKSKGSELSATLKRFAAAAEKGGATIVELKNERDPERQVKIWHVPIRFLAGHAYHLIKIKGPDFGFAIRTWVNGREAYARYVRDDVLPHLIDLHAAGKHGLHMH